MYRIENYLDFYEQKELYGILNFISNKDIGRYDISYVGEGINYAIFRVQVDGQTVCVRLGISEKNDKIFNLKRALSICENNGIITNKVLFNDFTCKKIHLPYMITTFIKGTTYNLYGWSEECIRQFFVDFGTYLAKLHNIKSLHFSKDLNEENGLDIRAYVSRRYQKLYEELKLYNNCSIDIRGINRIYQILYNAIDFESIVPSLIHRDISPSNIIQNNLKFHCLIDFEHAIFFDNIWDFAKLEINILSEIEPICREYLLKAYQKIIPLGKEKNCYQRFLMYYLLELMWAVAKDYNGARSVYAGILSDFVKKER